MIGFDAIGSVSIGELAGDPDVLVAVPAGAVTITLGAAPVVTAGKSVKPTASAVTVTTAAAVIRAGVKIAPPAVAVTLASSAAAVRISATVTTSSSAVAATVTNPFVTAGKQVKPPSAAVAAAVTVPVVRAGKSVAPPTASVVASPGATRISISATETVPVASVTVTTSPPQILGGNYIEADNTVTMVTAFGEIGSSSIGQLAIGEGEPSTRIVKIPPIIIISVVPPFITAGKIVKPTAANVNLVSSRAEIDSRGRKLRVFAIAS